MIWQRQLDLPGKGQSDNLMSGFAVWILYLNGSLLERISAHFEKFVDVLQIMRLTNFVLIEKGGLTS